jgi:N-acyl-D-amino-acid deacylase
VGLILVLVQNETSSSSKLNNFNLWIKTMKIKFISTLLCMLGVLASCGVEKQEPVGMVITNAIVIDGSGNPSKNVNVKVVGEKIFKIGSFSLSEKDTVIDAGGLVLAPGFIDVHSHHEFKLSEMPEALAAVSQGTTTIVAGMDGEQVFPLRDFFDQFETSPAAINVASFAGHGTIRSKVMGDDYKRHATAEELTKMKALLDVEMDAGALGINTGLEYDPGSFSAPEEVIELAKIAAAKGGRYASHVRSEDQYIWEAIDEVINIGREAKIPVQVSHIKLAMTRWWGQNEKLIAKLDQARMSGVDITADIYPYRAWNTSFDWLVTLFPDRDLNQRAGAEYILNGMLSPEGILLPNYLPNPDYNGKTIAEISEIRGTDPETTLMDLLIEENANGGGTQMLGSAMDEPDIEALMAWPYTTVGSDGELAGPHPRGYGTFTKFLGHYIRDRKVLSIEEGVRRMTSLSAAQVGIKERGLIREGYYADLVLFNPETVNDRSTPEKPHIPSDGIEKVWVNGELVYFDGSVTGKRPGKPIRR